MDLRKVTLLIFSKLEQQWLNHYEATTNIDEEEETTSIALFHLEIECWTSEPIQTTIKFYSDV